MNTWQSPSETRVDAVEHRVVQASDPVEAVEQLNALGAEGFEVFAVTVGQHGNAARIGHTYFLRRRKTVVLSERSEFEF